MNRRQFILCVAYVVALPLVRAGPPPRNRPAPWLVPDETGYSPAEQGELLLALVRGARVAEFDAAGGRPWRAERTVSGWRLLEGAGREVHTAHEGR